MSEALPISAAGLMPHGPGAQVIDQLTRVDGKTAWTRYTVKPGSLFVDENGLLDELAYVEMIAQSFAVWHAYDTPPERRAQLKGMLIGVKNLVVHHRAKSGDVLEVEVHKITKFGDFGVLDGTVRHADGRVLATGEIKIWGPDSEES